MLLDTLFMAIEIELYHTLSVILTRVRYKCMEAKEQQSTSKALRHMHPYMTSTPSRLKGSESESMKSSLSGIEPMSSSDMDDEQSRDYSNIAGLKADILKKLCKAYDIKLPRRQELCNYVMYLEYPL
ncbi:hypothetical protein ACF0H5_003497 [Mactra antiquata]